jgi:hypothetical protein
MPKLKENNEITCQSFGDYLPRYRDLKNRNRGPM